MKNLTTKDGDVKYTIVISDDHALVRGGLALIAKMAVQETVILQANSFDETISILKETSSIDLLLLDLMMPGMDADNSIKAICKQFPGIPIVIISVKEDFNSIQSCIAAGAAGYIPKTSPPNITISAIQLVLSGGIYIPPHILRSKQSEPLGSIQSSEQGVFDSLTQRQKDVFGQIVLGKSNQAIADYLGLTIPTIKMHVSAIFKKIQVKNRTEAVAKYSRLKEKTNYASAAS